MLQHILTISALTLSAAAAAGQTFDLVGLPAGTNSAPATGISDDGRIVVGQSGLVTNSNPHVGWYWTRAGGRVELAGAGLPSNTSAHGISGDGRYVVGSYNTTRAYRYDRIANTYDIINTPLPVDESIATDASGDGGVLAGYARIGSSTSAQYQAYRWTPQGGVQYLGYASPNHFRSYSTAISRDGATIVGYSQFGAPGDAFVWREGVGMTALPKLPGGENNSAAAFGVNFDGSVVVGMSAIGSDSIACVWRNSIITSLGPAPGFIRSSARATNDDGSIIVGQLQTNFVQTFQAGIWRQGIGWQRLDTYLASIGITLPAGVSLYEATSISADGNTISGWATVRNGTSLTSQGFVFSIPSPGSSFAIAVVSSLFAIRRKR